MESSTLPQVSLPELKHYVPYLPFAYEPSTHFRRSYKKPGRGERTPVEFMYSPGRVSKVWLDVTYQSQGTVNTIPVNPPCNDHEPHNKKEMGVIAPTGCLTTADRSLLF